MATRLDLARITTYGALTAAVVGLGAAIASAIDDLGPAITFCAEAGCQTVKQSAWARPLGIPMSLLGVGFFLVMLGLTFAARPRARRVRLGLAIAGAAWAVWLIGLQAFSIGVFCKLCMVADPAAIVLAACVAGGARPLEPRAPRLVALVPALGATVLVLAAWTRHPTPEAPPADTPAFVLDAQADDAVTIVEIVDFECPFCREMQKRLDAALARTQVPVRIVRKMMPLPMHDGAVPAAIAYCCADAQGKGEAMAKQLFAAEPERLTPYGCQQMALEVGCDLEQFKKDVPAAVERIQREVAEAKAAGVTGLPTMFIGHDRHTGATLSVDELVAAIEAHAPR